jgi:hypothetical protein
LKPVIFPAFNKAILSKSSCAKRNIEKRAYKNKLYRQDKFRQLPNNAVFQYSIIPPFQLGEAPNLLFPLIDKNGLFKITFQQNKPMVWDLPAVNVHSRYIKLSLPSSDLRYHNFF